MNSTAAAIWGSWCMAEPLEVRTGLANLGDFRSRRATLF
jgi:hypothetical protein